MNIGIRRGKINKKSFMYIPVECDSISLKRAGKGSISQENKNLTPLQKQAMNEFDKIIKEAFGK